MGVEFERRKDKRLYFTFSKGPRVSIMMPGQDSRTVSTKLLSLSAGGLSFIIPKLEASQVDVGDSLIVRRIHLPEPLGTIQRLDAEVRYIIEVANYFEVSIGCELARLSADIRQEIARFVEAYLEKNST